MATTLRVSQATRARAAALAQQTGSTIGELVERALDVYETADFWRQTQEALAQHQQALSPDPAWERSVRDGLDRD